jgi:two-component system CheB/CheR fusion protein
MTPPQVLNTASLPPVVGIGASAGGLEALQTLLAHLPTDTGLAFVIIQHLDPGRPSMLANVLSGATRLPVVEATNNMVAEPDRVHVIPAGSDLTIKRGILGLLPRTKAAELHLPIDAFFRALAADQPGRAIGVVLSGSGSDGTEGLRALKAEGGIGIAQSPDSAQFRSMPESAIAAGVVDFCASPAEIGRELVRLSRHSYVLNDGVTSPSPDDRRSLGAILASIRQRAGIDFGPYKQATIRRRIERRMAARHLHTLDEYSAAVRDDPDEARALARDMLIHVTTFFRDPDAFDALKTTVLEKLVREKEEGVPLRVWVPGCSTGEEVYAIGICLLECVAEQQRNVSIKLFGTDLSDEAIDTARAGLYSTSAVEDVPPARLSHYFDAVDGGYRVSKRLRDLCVFVKHDLTRDPPFAKLDLISCRNVLIYFDAELQRRVLPMLHYCLTNPGYLFLGASEAITTFRDLFEPVDREQRIFRKKGDSPRFAYPLSVGREPDVNVVPTPSPPRPPRAREAVRQADHLLLARFAPPGVVVNAELDIVQFRGRTGVYLEAPPGAPETNVLRMALPDLVAHLHDAIEHAKAESVAVRRDGIRVSTGAGLRVLDLEVVPLSASDESRERFFLILFLEAGPRQETGAAPPLAPEVGPAPSETEEVRRLRKDLLATRDYLQSVISDNESASGELAATNEELIAANEELQSTNEELQSAKEELQSVNEELTTMNDELASRNVELDKVANDLMNVLASVEIPIIIVDQELRVRRFTPRISDIASFMPSDLGRPINDLRLKVNLENLDEKVREVIRTMAVKEWEVQGEDGRWFRLQVRPYRTTDNRLDGAVLSFVDVDILKHALSDSERARDYVQRIVEAVPTPLVVLDADLRVKSATPAFYELVALSREAVAGKGFLDLDAAAFDLPVVRRALLEGAHEPVIFDELDISAEFSRTGRKELSLTARSISLEPSAAQTLLAVVDVTQVRQLEAQRAQLLRSETNARAEAERANKAKDLFLATLSHELRTPLSTTLMQAQVLKRAAAGDPRIHRASAAIERSVTTQSRLIEDLLDVSRIVSGKMVLDLRNVDLQDIVRNAADMSRPSAEAKSVALDVSIDEQVGSVYGDAVRLQQVVSNLLTNAIKFTPREGRISLRLEQLEGQAVLTVTDTGMGIPADVLPHLFEQFVQADSSVTRTHGGLGLGLAIVRHLVEAHGGEVSAFSAGEGQGATFRVTLPVGTARTGGDRTTGTTLTRDIAGVRLLLVEDDDDAREAFTQLLTKLGVDVRAASSVASGLATLKHWRPDVILSDIAMPGEDGYSFIRKVRALGPGHGGEIPAAALTALASDGDRQNALEEGFQMHLPKPCDAGRLAAAVATLAGRGPRQDLAGSLPGALQ